MKRRSFRLNRYIAISLVVVVILAAVVIVVVLKHSQAAAASRLAAANSAQPQFSFTGATDWYKGPTNKTSMALFSNDGACFTSIEHKTGTINVATALQQQQDDLAASGGVMTPGVTLTATVQTNTSQQQYELHQYSLSSGNEPLMNGLELGYLQLSSGYLEIQGHCNTADQLPTTIPALQAYKYDATD